MELELDERKEKILKTIVKTYLETGEPVGSRTISKLLDISISSATIRNEMSDLVDMGYIEQPHTSAGRVPSDKGYRFYVNNLIKEKNIELDTFKTEMTLKVDKLENMLKGLVKTISSNTNYPALISGPTIINNQIKYVQLSSLEGNNILVVIVAEGNVVKTYIVDMKKIILSKEILNLSIAINKLLTGKAFSYIIEENIKKDVSKLKSNKEEIKLIIDAIKEDINSQSSENHIFTFGANNFIKYKDYLDNDNINDLMETFEHKSKLAELVEDINNDPGNAALKIYIGEESHINAMKDCSVITANCDFGNGMKGTIGVVGPKRMDYEKVLKTLKNLMTKASKELGK